MDDTADQPEQAPKLPSKDTPVHAPKLRDVFEAERKKKVLIAAAVGITAVLAVAGTSVILALGEKGVAYREWQDGFCDKVEKYAKLGKLEGSGLEKLPEVVDINRCRQNFDCPFDITSCSTSCPLGHVKEVECATSCRCATKGRMQMDIQFNEKTIPIILEQTADRVAEDFTVIEHAEIKLWNQNVLNGRPQVPYDVDPALDQHHHDKLEKAFAIFQEKTCIDFVQRSVENDYLHLQIGNGDCSSSYSRVDGRNDVNIESCYSTSHILHILMHALGYHHEHMRDDRDAFLKINWENVDPEYKNAFKKLTHEYLPYVTDFDTRSIMMLDGYAFSVYAAEKIYPTMVDIKMNETATGGQTVFTSDDIVGIVVIYCNGAPESALADSIGARIAKDGRSAARATSWTTWTQWSGCLETCGASRSTRHRVCQLDTGFVAYGCAGQAMNTRYCAQEICQVVRGYWKAWGEFGECSKTCGTGIQWRSRECSGPDECAGDGMDGRQCNKQSCEEAEVWGKWTKWGECDATCGHAYHKRRRECLSLKDGLFNCTEPMDQHGFRYEIKECRLLPCAVRARSDADGEEDYAPTHLAQMDHKDAFNSNGVKIEEACDPSPSCHWFSGDFNGDELSDFLCGASVDMMQIFLSVRDGRYVPHWYGRLNCAIDFILIGDFNGDGISDIFCKDSLFSRNLIYPTSQRGFPTSYGDAGPFCMSMFDITHVADVNGDGRDDLLCRHAQLGGNTDIYISSLNRIGRIL